MRLREPEGHSKQIPNALLPELQLDVTSWNHRALGLTDFLRLNSLPLFLSLRGPLALPEPPCQAHHTPVGFWAPYH